MIIAMLMTVMLMMMIMMLIVLGDDDDSDADDDSCGPSCLCLWWYDGMIINCGTSHCGTSEHARENTARENTVRTRELRKERRYLAMESQNMGSVSRSPSGSPKRKRTSVSPSQSVPRSPSGPSGSPKRKRTSPEIYTQYSPRPLSASPSPKKSSKTTGKKKSMRAVKAMKTPAMKAMKSPAMEAKAMIPTAAPIAPHVKVKAKKSMRAMQAMKRAAMRAMKGYEDEVWDDDPTKIEEEEEAELATICSEQEDDFQSCDETQKAACADRDSRSAREDGQACDRLAAQRSRRSLSVLSSRPGICSERRLLSRGGCLGSGVPELSVLCSLIQKTLCSDGQSLSVLSSTLSAFARTLHPLSTFS